jgi:hypothetical protein
MKIIYRTQKLKSFKGISNSLAHSFRTIDTPNADPKKRGQNQHIKAKDIKEAKANFRARLPANDKIRKNAVYCIEHLVTASPEWFEGKTIKQQNNFFNDALTFIKDEFGGDENVVYAGIHRDETTPHMYVYLVPIDEKGKLNARKFLGGKKDRMVELQTDIAAKVGAKHGLERGQRKSKATHTTIREWYAQIAAVEAEISDMKPIKITMKDKLLSMAGKEPSYLAKANENMSKLRRLQEKLKHEQKTISDNVKSTELVRLELEEKQKSLNSEKKETHKTVIAAKQETDDVRNALRRVKSNFDEDIKAELENRYSELTEQLNTAKQQEKHVSDKLIELESKLEEIEPLAQKWQQLQTRTEHRPG